MHGHMNVTFNTFLIKQMSGTSVTVSMLATQSGSPFCVTCWLLVSLLVSKFSTKWITESDDISTSNCPSASCNHTTFQVIATSFLYGVFSLNTKNAKKQEIWQDMTPMNGHVN